MSYHPISITIAKRMPADEQILDFSIRFHLLFFNPIIIGSALAENYKMTDQRLILSGHVITISECS